MSDSLKRWIVLAAASAWTLLVGATGFELGWSGSKVAALGLRGRQRSP